MSDMRDATTGGSDHDPSTSPIGDGGATPAGASSGDETFGWAAHEEDSAPAGGDARTTAERMIGQLQSMIDSLATQAAPVARQIGAKAAELAAVAADRAGPLAHKAADATADAGVRLAEKSRTWAADLRTRSEEATGGDAESDSRSAVSVDGADDAAERSAQDDPAEGLRG